jgi:cold shock CspA family protein/ribosome-associated translation inhibitor RaiA
LKVIKFLSFQLEELDNLELEELNAMDIQIESRNVAMTPRWRTEIETRMQGLQDGHDDLTHGRVTLSKNRHHKKADNVAEALIVVSVKGRHTVTARKREKSFEEAIREAFEAVEGELRRIREKRASHEVRVPGAAPLHGVIARVLRGEGYGFILDDTGVEVYFHRNAVHDLNFDELEEGTEVSFNMEPGEKGPQATTVNPSNTILKSESL